MSTSTLAEVLDLPFALVTVFMAVIRALVTAPFRHRGTRRSPRSLYLYLVYSALRCLVIRISPKQCQMVMPSSHFTHQFVGMLAGQRRLAKAAAQGGSVKAEADTAVVLPHNATGHWVGAPEAEVVVMWFHGMFLWLLFLFLTPWWRSMRSNMKHETSKKQSVHTRITY